MKRFSVPFFVTFFGAHFLTIGGITLGFTLSHGSLPSLFVPSGLLIICSFIVGSLVVSFGFVRPAQMVFDTFHETVTLHQKRLHTNVLICECASRSSVFGGAVAFLLGVVGICNALWADVPTVGARIAEALVAPVAGLFFSRLIFRPLKARFLNLQMESIEKIQRLNRWTALEIIKGFCYGVIVAVILSLLTASYMVQISEYLTTIFR